MAVQLTQNHILVCISWRTQSYVDSSGNFSVTGVLLNRGNGYPENVWAVASFYNASGTVVAVGYSNFVTPHYLPPNQTADVHINSI